MLMMHLKKYGFPYNIANIIDSNLTNRLVEYESESVSLKRDCSQDSVLGSTLWNVSFNEVPDSLGTAPGVTFLLVSAYSRPNFHSYVRQASGKLFHNIESIGLEVDLHKTEAILFDNRNYPSSGSDSYFTTYPLEGLITL